MILVRVRVLNFIGKKKAHSMFVFQIQIIGVLSIAVYGWMLTNLASSVQLVKVELSQQLSHASPESE